MKIILTGSTGQIGSQILQHALSHPAITSIVALTRRELPIQNSKLTTIIHKNFTSYPPELLSQLQGAEACIWALGSAFAGREVHHDCTLAAMNAFEKAKLAGKFTFIYFSGAAVERDQTKTLWFLSDIRKMRGEVEKAVLGFRKEHDGMSVFIARPGAVLKKGSVAALVMGTVLPATLAVDEEVLAAAVVDVVVKGDGEGGIIENAELRGMGQEALNAMKK